MTTYVGATQAARMLGVSKPTLYAYVSRGLVSRRSAADGRTSLYARDEIELLAERTRKRPRGEPTIDITIRSAITAIDDASVRYRGHDAAELAVGHGFEAVAELLWTGSLPGGPVRWAVARRDLDRARTVVRAAGPVAPVTALALVAATLADEHSGAPGVARRLLAIAPTVLGGPQRGSVAERLAAAWHRSPAGEVIAAIDRALVLLADHELATSTLAVRVAASVGSPPADAIASGLHVVAGPLHGGAAAAVVHLLDDVADVGAREAVAGVLRSGRRLPGFGHSVYRTADPRLAPLLDAVRAVPASTERHDTVGALLAEAGRTVGAVPNVDLGLAALQYVAGLPADAPLFAVARIAGWAAHDAEERSERPVRYRGITRPRD